MQQVFLNFDLLRSCLEFPRKDLPLISFAKKSGKKLVDKTLLEEAHVAWVKVTLAVDSLKNKIELNLLRIFFQKIIS